MAFKTLMLVLDVKKCTLSIVVVKKVGMDWYISVEIFQHEKKSQGVDIYKNHQIKTVKIKKSNNKNNRSFLDFLFSTWVLVGF